MKSLLRSSIKAATLAAIAVPAALVPANGAAARAGWQDWGAWQLQSYGISCRNYVDATTTGSRLLVSGYFECNGGIGGSLTVNIGGTTRTKYCFAEEVARLGSCYTSFYVTNPSGSQSWTAVTISKIGGEPEAARISFRA
ncbi:hypothetical protein [Actinomadura sp. 21ATH]|uniref:hypothetical protein n=1 Tax=Actinomadura sp. 21ATH TaxID=1735444 RepID=UPI0035C00A60